jgi:hypothetical protein
MVLGRFENNLHNCSKNLFRILVFSEKFLGKVWWFYAFFVILAKHVLTRCRTKTMIFSGIQANREDSKKLDPFLI